MVKVASNYCITTYFSEVRCVKSGKTVTSRIQILSSICSIILMLKFVCRTLETRSLVGWIVLPGCRTNMVLHVYVKEELEGYNNRADFID